tara:strand:- start:195 stop:581 length:387 start_codon:yes stop_codon:yes gene_type:complete
MSTKRVKELEDKIEALEAGQRGTSTSLKNVQDFQAGVGRSAIPFQRFKTYFLGTILAFFGIGYIIYASQGEKNPDNRETDYIVGGICLGMGILLIFVFTIYARFVETNKDAQVFNAFLIESQMLAGRR